MKRNYSLILTILVGGCILFLQAGCQKQAGLVKEPKPMLPAQAKSLTKSPKITFEKVIFDLGEVGPGTRHPCEFKFTNTGKDLLKIQPIQTNCSCTLAALTKREYAPGESGTIEVKSFRAPAHEGPSDQQLYVYSNDEVNPKITLTIKAKVAMKVDYTPKMLNLFLKSENAGCPQITLRSVDNQPFAIKRFKSTADCITADINPSVKATNFVLKPKVDMEILGKVLAGRVDIGLTHPECSVINISFDALPRFKTEPTNIIIYGAEPGKSVSKEIWVLNNYNEDFEVESAASKKGFVKVLSQQKVDNSYKFELQITPPVADSKQRVFIDTFSVKIKGGEELKINCHGFYPKK